MIARTTAVIEAGGVLGELVCAPPLTLRQVHSDDRDRCELRLVGTAAGPLARDDLSVWLRLRPGARAVLRATGASLAQGRERGEPAALSIGADLAEGAELVADPGALVVCQGSRIDVRVELVLAAGAAVEWRELIVLGRTGEPPGRATLRWDVTRLGRPVLRQFVDLDPAADPGLTARAGLTAGRRVLACALICDPRAVPRTVVISPTAVAQRIDDHTLLATVLDDDAAHATRQLDDLCDRARGLKSPAFGSRSGLPYGHASRSSAPVTTAVAGSFFRTPGWTTTRSAMGNNGPADTLGLEAAIFAAAPAGELPAGRCKQCGYDSRAPLSLDIC